MPCLLGFSPGFPHEYIDQHPFCHTFYLCYASMVRPVSGTLLASQVATLVECVYSCVSKDLKIILCKKQKAGRYSSTFSLVSYLKTSFF